MSLCVSMCVSVCAYVSMYVSICVSLCVSISMCVCVSVCICVCMCTCTCVYSLNRRLLSKARQSQHSKGRLTYVVTEQKPVCLVGFLTRLFSLELGTKL